MRRSISPGRGGCWRGDLATVRVVFARALAPYIRERLWHPSQKLRDLTDGRVEMTLTVADTLEVRRWIVGYGVQAEWWRRPVEGRVEGGGGTGRCDVPASAQAASTRVER